MRWQPFLNRHIFGFVFTCDEFPWTFLVIFLPWMTFLTFLTFLTSWIHPLFWHLWHSPVSLICSTAILSYILNLSTTALQSRIHNPTPSLNARFWIPANFSSGNAFMATNLNAASYCVISQNKISQSQQKKNNSKNRITSKESFNFLSSFVLGLTTACALSSVTRSSISLSVNLTCLTYLTYLASSEYEETR